MSNSNSRETQIKMLDRSEPVILALALALALDTFYSAILSWSLMSIKFPFTINRVALGKTRLNISS